MNKKHPINENFVAIGCELLESAAWLAMKPHTRLIYIALLQEIRYYKDGTSNNGRVYLSTRMAARRVNITQSMAWHSFEEIEHYGFSVQTSRGVQGKKGRAARRRLTDIACDNPDGTKTAATKDYLDWDGVLYDPKAKRRKGQKPQDTTRRVISHRYQGPDTSQISGGDIPQVSGERQNGRFADTSQISDLNSFPFSSPVVSSPSPPLGAWPRNSQKPDEQLEPEPGPIRQEATKHVISDDLSIPEFLRRAPRDAEGYAVDPVTRNRIFDPFRNR